MRMRILVSKILFSLIIVSSHCIDFSYNLYDIDYRYQKSIHTSWKSQVNEKLFATSHMDNADYTERLIYRIGKLLLPGSPIPHTKAVANGRYLAGLLTWNGLVKSEGLATPSFFCAIFERLLEYKKQRLLISPLIFPIWQRVT